MTNYLSDFFELFDYPQQAREALWKVYRAVNRQPDTAAEWDRMMNEYIADTQCDFQAHLKWCEAFGKEHFVSEYTLQLLLFICHARHLRKLYAEKGIEDRFWMDAAGELKAKLFECYEVYGVWGTFVGFCFKAVFHLTGFVLGRLRFDMGPFRNVYEKNGLVLNEESTVIGVHIPRTGTPLTPAACEASYREAVKLFAPMLDGAPVVFVCSSWLLFPENKKMLSETSNIRAFMEAYDIYSVSYYNSDHPDLWRLFDTMEKNPDRLPANTSLRRGYIELLRRGERTGRAAGVYCPNFDKP